MAAEHADAHDPTHFQYCPKIVTFTEDLSSVLLVRRFGEADYDGVYSFPGGKMETSDADLLAGIRREKIEELGPDAKVSVVPEYSYNVMFRKRDGNAMVLPHVVAIYYGGEIRVNPDEYSEYRFVPLDELDPFEPKIETVPEAVRSAQRLLGMLARTEFILL